MKGSWLIVMLVGVFAVGVMGPTTVEAKSFEYVGVKDCRKCHRKKKDGEQFKIWQKSDHSKAFEALASKEAKEKAAELGVSGNPQEAEACLVCHTAGYGEPKSKFRRKFKVSDGVQCENCHGPGSGYKKKKIMKKIYEERGPDKKGASPTAEKYGLTIPDENTCKTCHVKEITRNGKTFKNPSYKPFDFAKMVKKIEHPVPR